MSPNHLRVNSFSRVIAAALVLAFATSHSAAQEKLSRAQTEFFETKIRPVLADNCYACHSQKTGESQGGLALDTRAGIRRGGNSGPAVVPSKVKSSMLLSAIRHTTDDLIMPPEDEGEKLAESVIKDFETWIKMGAPDPRDGAAPAVSRFDNSEALSWWSFQPINGNAVPAKIPTEHANWARTQIDQFVASKWEQSGLSPVGDAEPHVLLRRLRFDLTGIPPSDNEVAYFVKRWKKSPEKREELLQNVIDSLLRSHEYAERWGRHWLDVARFAESSGKDVNLVYPHAWRYRDYVIESFHEDKSFDQFLREQVAGDLLPAKDASQRAEQLTATAFLALGENPINERNPKQFAVDLADDQIGTVTQAFLGITASCARCHDHRFDPVSQKDYTALAGIFLSTETKYGTAGAVGGRNRAPLIELPADAGLPVIAEGLSTLEIRIKQQKMDRLQEQQRSARGQRANGGRATDGLTDFDLVRINTQISQLEFELSMVNDNGSAKPLTMGVGDRPVTAPQTRRRRPTRRGQQMQPGGGMRGGEGGMRGRRRQGQEGQQRQRGPGMRQNGQGQQRGPGRPMQAEGGQQAGKDQQNRRVRSSGFEQIGDSPLFLRGSIDNVGDPIPRGVPGLLGAGKDVLIRKGSGRLELANALVSDRNTLTARVIVNRVWHWLFGKGLVESIDNFGTSGAEPANAELLDYLAARFVKNDWSIKQLIRDITLSRVYRLSSKYDPKSFAADPGNKMLWRHSSRRLEAEELRDGILAASGQLDLRPDAGSMIGRAGDGPIGGLRFQAVTLDQISNADNKFRSIYLPATRSVEPDVLAAFDPADSSATDGARDTTNVPAQALFMLNSDFVASQSQTLANLAFKKHPDSGRHDTNLNRLQFVFQRVLNRTPSATEIESATRLLQQQGNHRGAWTSLVRGLFGSAEFRLVD